jgi:hypothetical protein
MTIFKPVIGACVALILGACGQVNSVATVDLGIMTFQSNLQVTLEAPVVSPYPAYYTCYQPLFPTHHPSGCGYPNRGNNWWKY